MAGKTPLQNGFFIVLKDYFEAARAIAKARRLSQKTLFFSSENVSLIAPSKSDYTCATHEGMNLLEQFERRSPVFFIWACLVFVAIIGAADFVTGAELFFSVFYLLAVGVGTWFVGRKISGLFSRC